MKSKVKVIATQKGIKTPQELSYEARISWPTAKSVWVGDLSNTRATTLRKVATALSCKMEDLFIFEPN